MSTHLNEFSPGSMIAFNDANLLGWVEITSLMGRFTANEPPGVKRSIVDIPYAELNSIADTRLAPSEVEAAIQFVISDARRRQVPVLWWINPSTQPADLEKYLEHHGFRLDEDSAGMAVELAKLDQGLKKVPGLSIECVRDEAARLQWGRNMAAGFEIPPTVEFVVKAWRDLLSLADPEILSAYIGYLDNQPVATSVLCLAGGAAGIYGVSTLPSARRKGIGAWMTLQPLLDARDKGYKVGVLQASQMGEGVYRSLGFQEYCRIRSYRFRP